LKTLGDTSTWGSLLISEDIIKINSTGSGYGLWRAFVSTVMNLLVP